MDEKTNRLVASNKTNQFWKKRCAYEKREEVDLMFILLNLESM
jgi:hypothetical protein